MGNNMYVPEKITFKVEFITPLFMGGAEKEKAELRESSLKGLLRFWWRVANGYRYDSVENLYKAESEIFGSTEKKSTFNLKIDNIDKNPEKDKNIFSEGLSYEVNSSRGKFKLNILDYLAYGSVINYNKELRGNELIKEYYQAGTQCDIIFNFYNHEVKNDVLLAFYLLQYYGGLGAKSRNGFGSFQIINEEGKNLIRNITFEKSTYNNVEPKDYLIFSKEIKKFTSDRLREKSWQMALSTIGLIYREVRLSLEPKHKFDERAKLALPIVAQGENVPDRYKNGRLAKPIFLHVSKKGENLFEGSILVIPHKSGNIYDKSFWEKVKIEFETRIDGKKK